MQQAGQEETIEAAQEQASNPETEEYLEMEKLFAKHGKETEPETITGTAILSDFTIHPAFDTNDDGVTIRLYFTLPTPTENVGKFGATHTDDSPHPVIETILEKNYNPHRFSDVLGTELSIRKQSDETEWTVDGLNMTLQEVSECPEWDASERNEMDELFNNEITRTDTSDMPTSGKAKIVDYYVRSSAGNIEQKLEVGVQFSLPNGDLDMYECIHDENHPDEGLTALLNYCGSPENLYELKGEMIPVRFDAEDESWSMHIPHDNDYIYLLYGLERLGVKRPSRRRQFTIEKTYKHADGRQPDDPKVNELKRKQKMVQMLEAQDISVHGA